MTYEYDKAAIDVFLKKQLQLFPKPVATDEEEAYDFLDMCMAVICKNYKELKAYLDEVGLDIAGMSKAEIEGAAEVFKLPDGRYLVVEA